DLWDFEEILDHRWSPDPKRRGKIDILLKWKGYVEPTWEPKENIRKDDPVSLAAYAKKKGLLKHSRWSWANTYLRRDKKFSRMLKQVHLYKKKSNLIKFNFGVRIPRSIREAMLLDKANGNTKWKDAIETELRALYEDNKCFKALKSKSEIPSGYKYVPLLWAFAVKFDLRHRARCVAGGHVTEDLEFDIYSGVVDLETVRIALVAAILTSLRIVAADIGSAYIQAFTMEKIYTIAGPEWEVLGMEGTVLIVEKALYGLKSSGAMWHRKLADNMREMGFKPCQADHDFWIRDKGDHHEYIAIIVDDLLIFSRDAMSILNTMKKDYGYIFKGVGTPEYYNGADFSFTEEGFPVISAKTFIGNVCSKIEKLLEIKLKNYGSPMTTGDHPENDESDLLPGGEITIYQMLIGCAQWAVTLGRFDIQYATNTLARYATAPREGHKKRTIKIFGYLKHKSKGRMVFDPRPLNYDQVKFEEHDWTDLYPFAMEHIPDVILITYNDFILELCIIVDASHADCDVTRRSTTGIVALLGRTVIKTYCKRQHTVESSTYGSELVALRIAVEMALELRYKLRMMGIKFNPVTTILCDNMSVVINAQFPTSSLKKKHNAVAYHKVREAVSAGIVRIGHIRSELNLADILTKPLSPLRFYELLRGVLFPNNKPVLNQGELKETTFQE
ncbi:MAG: reverse transcriptase domain-containing protein, partial [Bacteroidota bacterium]